MINTLKNINTISPSIPIKKYRENQLSFQSEEQSSSKRTQEISYKHINNVDDINKSNNKILSDFNDFHSLKKELNVNLDKLYSEVKNVENQLKKEKRNIKMNANMNSTDYSKLSDTLKKSMKKNLDNINEYANVKINDVNAFDGSLNIIYQTLKNTVLFSITEALSIEDLSIDNPEVNISNKSNENSFDSFYEKINNIKTNLNKTEEKIGKENDFNTIEKQLNSIKKQKIEDIKLSDNFKNNVDIYV